MKPIERDKRLLLQLDQHRRDINRKHISEKVGDLDLTKLTPIVEMVARSRARYIGELFDVAHVTGTDVPTRGQINKLKSMREEFTELVDAVNALETAVERNYVDVLEEAITGAA